VFRLFTPLFDEFDRLVLDFTGAASARVMTAVTPVVEASLVLWFTWWGFLVMRGELREPLLEYLWRVVRTSMVVSVALGAGYYQSTVGELVRTVPDDLAAAVMGDDARLYTFGAEPVALGASTAGAGALIDVAAGKGIVASMEAMQTATLFSKEGLACLFLGCCVFLATILMVGIGGANILVAKIVLGVLVALGPLFIVALLFESTRRFFERWAAMIVTYALVLVLFAVFFTFMLGVFDHYVGELRFDGTQNVGYAVAGALVIATVSILTLFEAKVLAMGLGSGITLPRWAFVRSFFVHHRRHESGKETKGVAG